MRRWLSITVLTSILAGGVAILWLPLSRTAQPAVKNLLTLPPSPPLPINQVILFNSGVGYFQREGEISGDSQVELALPAKDVNDLLKSLVLQDAGGGKVTSVTYDNQDPIEKTLQSFALDLTYNPTFGELLNQARGEKIEVTLQTPGSPAGSVIGIIVGMESDPLPTAGTATTGANSNVNPSTNFLNLLSPDGLKRIPLGRIERVRFTNAALQSEFDAALALLTTAHDPQKLHRFEGHQAGSPMLHFPPTGTPPSRRNKGHSVVFNCRRNSSIFMRHPLPAYFARRLAACAALGCS